MTTVTRNILANAVGSGLTMAVFLAVVPVYLRLLGPEAYGLVGLFTTVMVGALLVDLGLGATLNREVARLTAGAADPGGFADVAATLRGACWAVGLVVSGLFIAIAPTVATRWLTFSALSVEEVQRALTLMGVALPALVARGFALAGLNGLQRQLLANLVHVGGLAARALVTVAALLLVAPTITVFLVAQVPVLYVEAVALGLALREGLPAASRGGRIRPASLRPLLGFAGGIGGTMLLALVLTSLDKVILSGILSLAEFGYYTLAVAVAAALGQLVQPVTTAVYPRFSQLADHADLTDIAEEYHFFSQLVAVLVLPLGALLVVFPDAVLALWMRDPALVRYAALVLSLRAIGTVLGALMHVPHVVQLAFGWSSLGAWINAIAVLVLVPATVALAIAWGGAGAAMGWIGLNLGVLVFAMRRMHHRVLPGELARWYRDLLWPALAVAGLAVASRAAMPDMLPMPARLAWLAATGGLSTVAALAAASTVRRRVVTATMARLA
jgi:O-antigen/teichoic acid export membrane protein